jgi:hypothetical protein
MAATTIKWRRRRRPLRRPGAVATALITWATFLAVFVLLSLQLRSGRDPVLSAERPAVIRRVVVTKVVHGAAAPAVAAPSAPAPSAPAPVTTSSS